MNKYILVFLGGGVGSMARLFLTSADGKQTGTAFPGEPSPSISLDLWRSDYSLS